MSGEASSPAKIVPQRLVIVLPTDGLRDSRTRRIATSLRERGHSVSVLARRSESTVEDETDGLGVRTIRVEHDPIDGLPLPAAARRALHRILGRRRGAGPRSRSPGSSPGRLARTLAEMVRFVGIGLRIRSQTRFALAADPGADLYHGMAFQGIPVALGLARQSRAPALYDIRDIYLESRNLARLPGPARRALGRLERGWIRRARRVTTVNHSCAEIVERRYGARPTIVMNCPVRRAEASPRQDLVRDALGLFASSPIVLYHGGLLVDRGLPQAIAAMADPRLTAVHLVLMGWGEEESNVRELARNPAVAGRVHLLPPVPPDDVVDWVGSADVAIMVNQPRTLNERISTPNKLFESLTAGTPVVSSDFPERRRIVIDDPLGPLGAVCDPTDPAAIAGAICAIIELGPIAAADLRMRCAQAARERYTWEAQLPKLLAEYGAATGRPW